MARQLVFDLAHTPSYADEDFLVSGSNAEAYRMIARWPDWPAPHLLLVGPPGSGKSHLAAIWARAAGAVFWRADAPSMGVLPSAGGAVLADDADRLLQDEAAFFHLINAVKEQGATLLMTARAPPAFWGVRTPDLLSRLRLTPAVPIGEPDTELLSALLVKLFADRQIRIEMDVVAYAARHCARSFEAVSRFVAAADAESLAEGRRISRPLAARILAALGGDGESDVP